MNLRAMLLPLDDKEKKILKLVFIISLAACLLAVATTWGIKKAGLSAQMEKHQVEDSNHSDLAEIYAKKGRELIKDDLDAHRFAARYFMRTNQPQRAIPHLLRLLSIDREERFERLQLSEAYLSAGLFAKALEELSELNNQRQEDTLTPAIMALYGLALFHTGEIARSIEVLDKALELNPDSPEAACYRGQVEAATNGGSPEAEDYFRRALRLNPDYTEALYQWARFLMNRPGRTDADLDSARLHLLRVLEIEPLSPKSHARLGMLYYYLGQLDIAEKSYRTALKINPDDYNTHYNLGELYCSMYWNREDLSEETKRTLRKKALDEFKKTLDIDSAHAEAHFKTGLICLENNDLNPAIRHFEQARALDPKNIRVLFQLGVSYEKKNMRPEALSAYNAILDLDPVNRVAQQKIKLLAGNNG